MPSIPRRRGRGRLLAGRCAGEVPLSEEGAASGSVPCPSPEQLRGFTSLRGTAAAKCCGAARARDGTRCGCPPGAGWVPCEAGCCLQHPRVPSSLIQTPIIPQGARERMNGFCVPPLQGSGFPWCNNPFGAPQGWQLPNPCRCPRAPHRASVSLPAARPAPSRVPTSRGS